MTSASHHSERSLGSFLRRNGGLLLGLLISIACVVLLVFEVNWRQVLPAFQATAPLPFLLAVVLQWIQLVLRGWRWQILLGTFSPVRFKPTYRIWMIGLMLNDVLPAKIGEVSRAYLISRREHCRLPTVFSTVFIERLLDVLAFLGALAVVLIMGIFPLKLGEWDLSALSVMLGWLVLAGLVVLVVVAFFQRQIVRLADGVLSRLHAGAARWVTRVLDQFLAGMNPRAYGSRLLAAAGLTLVAWILIIASTYCVFWAVGAGELDWRDATLFIVTTTFCMLIPNTPGYFGTFHFLAVETLIFRGIAGSQALVIAVLCHSSWYFLETILGIWYVFVMGVSFRELRAASEKIEESGEVG
jgi:glycosyltransferase 2 family protein